MSEQALADGEQRAAWVVAFDVLGKRVEDECLGPLDASQVARCMRPLIQEHAAEVEQALVVELEGVVDVVRLAHQSGDRLRERNASGPVYGSRGVDLSIQTGVGTPAIEQALEDEAHVADAFERVGLVMEEHIRSRLGLDHFEGRSWHGLHHHAVLGMIAFAFLQHLRLREKNS